MNDFTFFLGFALIITAMFMSFPERARKATMCLKQLIDAVVKLKK